MSEFELTEEQAAAIEARQAEGCPDDWAPEPEAEADAEEAGRRG